MNVVAPTTRLERARYARALIEKGHPRTEVAEMLHLRPAGLRGLLNDPDGSKQKKRRERYRGTCRKCGSRTDGSSGYNAPTVCNSCARAKQHEDRYWTSERVVAALLRWNETRGRAPYSREWLRATAAELTDADGYRYPFYSEVRNECGSWENALRLAGLEPAPNPKARKSRAYYLEMLREQSRDGVAPPANGTLRMGILRYGLTWEQACELVGVRPTGRRRRDLSYYLDAIRAVSVDGIAPSSKDPRASLITQGLGKRGLTWSQGCARAGVRTRRQARSALH